MTPATAFQVPVAAAPTGPVAIPPGARNSSGAAVPPGRERPFFASYRLKKALQAGTFEFATLAVLFALRCGLPTEWEACA